MTAARIVVAAVVTLVALAGAAIPASAMKTAPSPPKAEWSRAGFDYIPICFPNVPPGFAAKLQVEHVWTGHPKPAVGVFRFTFKPPTRFSLPMYRGATRYDEFSTSCLEIYPRIKGFGERRGYFSLTYVYQGKKVSSATFKYLISNSQGHYAKQGSDEYFNYCLKERPETIFSSGGVLQCKVPANKLVLWARAPKVGA